MTNWRKSFREAFCEYYGCSPQRFEAVAARKALPGSVRLVRPFLLVLHPGHFRLDIELMQNLGESRNWQEVHAAVAAFRNNNKMRGGFWRNTVKWRASGRRISRLVRRVIGEPEP